MRIIFSILAIGGYLLATSVYGAHENRSVPAATELVRYVEQVIPRSGGDGSARSARALEIKRLAMEMDFFEQSAALAANFRTVARKKPIGSAARNELMRDVEHHVDQAKRFASSIVQKAEALAPSIDSDEIRKMLKAVQGQLDGLASDTEVDEQTGEPGATDNPDSPS